ncbi:hypothetical protein [Marinobacter salarius]|uniref:hypothetical protein n=1 Tax=Marinobacter salarius TaxID=1420917 RepID=UPI003BA863A6
MRITTDMLRELEEAIAPDAKSEIRIYAGGCDIRVCWNGGLKQVNQNLGVVQLSEIVEYRDEKMRRAWDKVIEKFRRLAVQ